MLAPAIDAVALMEIIEVALDVRLALAAGDLDCGLGRFIDYWSGPGSWAGMPPEKRAAFAPQLAQVALDFDALLSDPAGLDDVRDLGLPTLIVQGGATRCRRAASAGSCARRCRGRNSKWCPTPGTCFPSRTAIR